MKSNILEHIILYVLVACAVLAIATLARVSATSMGFDSFTAFMVFLIVVAIQVVVYLSIHVVLQNLMLPLIEKGLAKIPYFRNKIEEMQVPIIANTIVAEEVETVEEVIIETAETTVEEKQEEEKNRLPNTPEHPSLEDIRKEQLQIRIKEQDEKLNIALNYTRKSFALYLSDEHLEILCRDVKVYADKLDGKELKPVKIKELTALDLRHFGWNIWKHFVEDRRDQMDIAYLLKNVFPDVFRNAEVESIKRHLKDDELKGVIKILENLSL